MYNFDLPAMQPFDVGDGGFYALALPESWKEILEEKVPFVMEILENSKTYLAGGLLRTMVSSNEPLSPNSTDVDLFFQDSVAFEAVKLYFQDVPEFEVIFQCPENKLTTFIDHSTGWKYQCITMAFYPTLQNVVESFDFTCTCFGTDGENFIFHQAAIEDTLSKSLRWNKITHPVSSMRRMMKYARKGYTMPESECQYFVECVSNHSPDIIDEILVYVD